MNRKVLYSAAALLLAGMPSFAHADTFNLNFSGPGASGNIVLTYGSAHDAKYPQALEVTGISGVVSDAHLHIVNASITGLVPINHAAPTVDNIEAPNDFSKFPVAMGTMDGSLSFDNLLYPGGSPQTAPPLDYPFHGGLLDIYGLLFTINNGGTVDTVNVWSNGLLPGATADDYGFAVATSATTLDYVGNGIAVAPEPGSLVLLGTGALALLGRRRRS